MIQNNIIDGPIGCEDALLSELVLPLQHLMNLVDHKLLNNLWVMAHDGPDLIVGEKPLSQYLDTCLDVISSERSEITINL